MNKLSIMVKSIAIAMSMVGIAHAELNNWTGFYAGINAGFAFNHTELTSQHSGFINPNENCNASSNFSTFAPGIQLGYMHQFPSFLVSGIEANATVNTHQKDILSCDCPDYPDVSDRFTFKNQMQSSIKGRVGRALIWHDNMLVPYVTAGASIAAAGLTYKNEGGDYYSQHATHTGWLVGAGIEWALRSHWSLRAEYFYADYGNIIKLNLPSVYELVDLNGHAHVALRSNNVIVAINYWI